MHALIEDLVRRPTADPQSIDAATARSLVSAYLGQWPEVSRDEWPAVLGSADRLGSVHRAASWDRLLREVDPDRLGVPPPRIADWVREALT